MCFCVLGMVQWWYHHNFIQILPPLVWHDDDFKTKDCDYCCERIVCNYNYKKNKLSNKTRKFKTNHRIQKEQFVTLKKIAFFLFFLFFFQTGFTIFTYCCCCCFFSLCCLTSWLVSTTALFSSKKKLNKPNKTEDFFLNHCFFLIIWWLMLSLKFSKLWHFFTD